LYKTLLGKLSGNRHNQATSLRLVLVLLVFVVLVPTISVLWFMSKAVENARFAVRQSLSEVLELRLADTRRSIDEYWEQTFLTLSRLAGNTQSPAAFKSIVASGLVDSVILYDAAGRIAYPNSPDLQIPVADSDAAAWQAAEKAEFVYQDPAAAAELYAAIADDSSSTTLIARALLAESRCRLQAGQKEAAITLITETLQQPRLQSATTPAGRLIAPSAQLLALGAIGNSEHSAFEAIVVSLQERLSSYDDALLTGAQRRFLMKALLQAEPSLEPFPTLKAEELAALYLDTENDIAEQSVLRPSTVPGVWHMALPGEKDTVLFSEERIRGAINEIIASQSIPGGTVIEVLSNIPESTTLTYGIPASQYLPDWQLSFGFEGSSIFNSLERGQVTSYVWTGTLVIAAALCLAAILASYLTRQLRQAQLKNDLVATVSHELKTPLSSMRILVDTLLNDEKTDQKKSREYLRIISRENIRLSQLIDNFLNYSRISRNRQAFALESLDPAELAKQAADAVTEKFARAGFELEVDLRAGLPKIEADSDALVTALINLLDNAYKYSGTSQQVTLKVYQQNDFVVFSVIDYGIGLSKKEKDKVFEKFYRADRKLTSTTSGVGLGLSIVKSIVEGHNGTIKVDSIPGEGSTFSICIPVSPAENTGNVSLADE